jgi:hypothetical protein
MLWRSDEDLKPELLGKDSFKTAGGGHAGILLLPSWAVADETEKSDPDPL